MIPHLKNQTAHGLSNLRSNADWNPLLKNYSRAPVDFVLGDGIYLYDSTGKKYLDFLCGIAVTGFGHNHPAIKSAVKEQVEKLWHVSNLFESGLQKSLAQKLAARSGLDSVFFCNSGTEANEAAIKFARKWGGEKKHIITALDGFHGRTMGSLSASAKFKMWEGFFPLTPGFVYVPFGDMDAIENSFDEHTAAIMIEPVQGEAGINIPYNGYLKDLRKFCDEKEILLILDEIQTGIGRTGKFFAFEHEKITPDIVTLAKGIANGLPLGVAICSKEVAEAITPGSHGSTFGGNPIAVTSANAVVDLIDVSLLDHITVTGDQIVSGIKSIQSGSIKDVRGKGLMIGVEFNEKISAKEIAAKLLNAGVVVCTAGENVLRILPPFIVTGSEVEQFLSQLAYVLND